MHTDNFWRGNTVRLTGLTREDMPALARWHNDAGYLRLLEAGPARPRSVEELERWLADGQKSERDFYFAIRPIDADELLGIVELGSILWTHGVAWLAISIGEREKWGQGYGQEAMQLILNFAFNELNLHRVQLTVFEYNVRAIAVYENMGFHREGVYREFMQRDGRRYDMYLYGILRSEYLSGSRP